jgi:(1->4)-alpha-D-glucan 1-alpha-D-glucosylmutase
MVRGRLAPTRTTDHFIYQALVGIWPRGEGTAASHENAEVLGALRERLTPYIQKAVREAKVSTSWTDPDEEYERAVATFVAGLLDPASPGRYLRDVAPLVAEVAATGMWNALARLTVHLTSPGVSDLYQGDELWFLALVDPDNRRPVDWAAREERLESVRRACESGVDGVPPLEVLRRWRDDVAGGTLKLYLTTRLLRLRRGEQGGALTCGGYSPIAAEGLHAERAIAFRRGDGVAARIILVPRLTAALGNDAGAPIGGARWGDTRLAGVEGGGVRGWRCLLSGVEVPAWDGVLQVGDALAELPVALLAPVKSA